MESQPQNPKFRTNPENFHLCFYENMISLDSAKSGLECGAKIDEYDYQNNEKKSTLHYEKIRVHHCICALYNKNHVIPHPGFEDCEFVDG